MKNRQEVVAKGEHGDENNNAAYTVPIPGLTRYKKCCEDRPLKDCKSSQDPISDSRWCGHENDCLPGHTDISNLQHCDTR